MPRTTQKMGDKVMQVKDVMTANVITIQADASILKAARVMLQNHISGLPVVDKKGELIGIVTESDFLRRRELGTQRHRPRWLEIIVGPGRLAEEYVHTAGRKVEEIMTSNPIVVAETDSLWALVGLMERRHVKRFPVMREGRIVGIISRANLMHALENLAREPDSPPGSDKPGPDWAIRGEILAALGKLRWAPNINVMVRNGVAELRGLITDDRERQGLIVAAENIAGVKQVHDHLVWVEPMSGMAFPSNEDEAKERAESSAQSPVN
jgi:CBS domain-containing protein